MRENAFCMVFHVKWISHHLSQNPTLVASDSGWIRRLVVRKIHLTWKTIQNAYLHHHGKSVIFCIGSMIWTLSILVHVCTLTLLPRSFTILVWLLCPCFFTIPVWLLCPRFFTIPVWLLCPRFFTIPVWLLCPRFFTIPVWLLCPRFFTIPVWPLCPCFFTIPVLPLCRRSFTIPVWPRTSKAKFLQYFFKLAGSTPNENSCQVIHSW